MSAIADECVRAVLSSVKWLDQYKPGWASKIDLDNFDFLWATKCVSRQLGMSLEEMKQSRGFDSPIDIDSPDFDFSYAHMDSLWRIFIQKRLDHAIPKAN